MVFGLSDGTLGAGLCIAVINNLPEMLRPLGISIYQSLTCMSSACAPALGGKQLACERTHIWVSCVSTLLAKPPGGFVSVWYRLCRTYMPTPESTCWGTQGIFDRVTSESDTREPKVTYTLAEKILRKCRLIRVHFLSPFGQILDTAETLLKRASVYKTRIALKHTLGAEVNCEFLVLSLKSLELNEANQSACCWEKIQLCNQMQYSHLRCQQFIKSFLYLGFCLNVQSPENLTVSRSS